MFTKISADSLLQQVLLQIYSCYANQLTGFYMRATLSLNGLSSGYAMQTLCKWSARFGEKRCQCVHQICTSLFKQFLHLQITVQQRYVPFKQFLHLKITFEQRHVPLSSYLPCL